MHSAAPGTLDSQGSAATTPLPNTGKRSRRGLAVLPHLMRRRPCPPVDRPRPRRGSTYPVSGPCTSTRRPVRVVCHFPSSPLELPARYPSVFICRAYLSTVFIEILLISIPSSARSPVSISIEPLIRSVECSPIRRVKRLPRGAAVKVQSKAPPTREPSLLSVSLKEYSNPETSDHLPIHIFDVLSRQWQGDAFASSYGFDLFWRHVIRAPGSSNSKRRFVFCSRSIPAEKRFFVSKK